MGEAKRRKLAGDYPKGFSEPKADYAGPPELATTIWADFEDGTFTAVVEPKQIGDMLKSVDATEKKNNLSRSSAKDWVIQTFKENKHCRPEEGSSLAHTLLWLACRSEIGEQVEDAAKGGGKSIGYEITCTGGRSYNFRLAILDGHVSKDRNLANKPAAGNA